MSPPLIAPCDLADVMAGRIDRDDLPAIDLSVVTYRSAEDLPGFFDSLVAQDYPLAKINLLLVRHHPDPEEAAVIRAFAERHGGDLLSLDVREQDNRGFGAGHNANFRDGAARYFIVSNADIEFFHDTLTKLVLFAEASAPDCAAVEARQFPFNHPKFYDPSTFETAWLVCCLSLFDRAAFAETGGFDEVLFMYGEDVDLSLRLRALGYRIAFNPHAVVKHTVTRNRERAPMVTGGFEATWLVRLSTNPLQAALLLTPRHMLSLLQYLRLRGWRSGMRRLAAVGRRALSRRRAGRANRSRRLPNGVNGHEFEWRRPFEASVDDLAVKQEAGRAVAFRITVSILIRVTAGRGASFEFALRTAVAQTYPLVEIIVLEDGSREMRDRVERYRTAGFEIRYLSVGRVGRSQACNLLLAAARGTHCIFLDDDDFLFLEHVETLVEDGIGDDGAFGAAWAISVLGKRWQGRLTDKRFALPSWYEDEFDHDAMRRVNYFPIQSIIFSHRDALAVGRINVDLDYLEDWSFFAKLTAGKPGTVVKQVTSAFRLPSGWMARRQRGKLHYTAYEAARDDIEGFLDRRREAPGSTQTAIRLLYHRIGAAECDPFALFVTPERFRQHLDVIVNRMDKGIVAREGSTGDAPLKVEIHFDDAYADTAPYIAACRDRGLCVRVFATGYSFDETRMMPSDEYLSFLRRDFALTTEASRRAANGRASDLPGREAAVDEWYRFFGDLWKEEPEAAREILTTVRRSIPVDGVPEASASADLLMAPADLKGLADGGSLVGAHGAAHERLSRRTPDVVAADAGGSAKLVARIDEKGARHFAFPFGGATDIDASAVRTLGEAGFDHLYSCLGKDVDVGAARILGRFQVGDLDALNFAECFDRCAAAILADGNLEAINANHFLHDVVHVVEDTGW